MSDWVDVEVPRVGTVIVEDAEVHDGREKGTRFIPCWCTDGRHSPVYRWGDDEESLVVKSMVTPRAEEPHLIGVKLVEMVWRVQR
jgi:hypothetical protein